LIPVAALLWITHKSRAGRAYDSGSGHPPAPRRLGPFVGLCAAAACALPVVLGFAVPAMHLVRLAGERLLERGVSPMLLAYAWTARVSRPLQRLSRSRPVLRSASFSAAGEPTAPPA
jgi:ABC-type Fe3+ transport system permease subunit